MNTLVFVKTPAFGDLDVLAIGPIVQEVSDMFDTYWNHETALPVPAFLKELDDPEGTLDELRARLEAANDEIRNTRYANAVRERGLRLCRGRREYF